MGSPNAILNDMKKLKLATYEIRFDQRRENLEVPIHFTKEQLLRLFSKRCLELFELYPKVERVKLYAIGHLITSKPRCILWQLKARFDDRLIPCKKCGQYDYHLQSCEDRNEYYVGNFESILEEYRQKFKDK